MNILRAALQWLKDGNQQPTATSTPAVPPSPRKKNGVFVAPTRAERITAFVSRHRVEIASIALILTVALVAHGWNMFNFPHYENDEATYLARGWTFVTTGDLDPYTYRYEHAPFGWIVIGGWLLLTGGTTFFSSFLVSGRVFMLLVHLASVLLTYKIGKNLFNRRTGIVASLLYTLSPLSIFFGRRVLLDNIMSLFVLLSIYLLTRKSLTLSKVLLSAVAFALATLSKLNAGIMAPAILYLIWIRSNPNMRRHALVQWVLIVGLISSSYFMLAIIKGELLPAPIGPDGFPERISLLDSLRLQASRGDFAWPWEPNSSFIVNVKSWAQKDVMAIIYGSFATVATLIIGIKKENFRVLGLIIVAQVLFLARGKIVLDLYITPLIPFLALAVAAVVLSPTDLSKWSGLRRVNTLLLSAVVILAPLRITPQIQYVKDETTNQLRAVDWITENAPRESAIVIDNYAYTELQYQSHYHNADYMFMVEYDPRIRYDELENDWRNIDYILVTHEVIKQMANGSLPFIKEAFLHSELVADYRFGASSFIDIPKLISTNGDWAQVYEVKDRRHVVLQQSWEHFLDTFYEDYGQIVDPLNDGLTTSGAQATALLRAVEQGDRQSFDGIWAWTNDHLRFRSTDSLQSWLWEKQADGEYGLSDTNTTTDADVKTAYALLQAAERWNETDYADQAEQLIDDIWDRTVFTAGGNLYLDSSADGSIDTRLVNPSYLNPVAFSAFADIDPDHAWDKLSSDMYSLVESLQHPTTGLIPSWVQINRSGTVLSAAPIIGNTATRFDNQTIRIIANLANSWYTNGDERAKETLTKIGAFFQSELDADRELVNFYNLDGSTTSDDIDFAMQTAAIIALAANGETDEARAVLRDAVFSSYDADLGSWASPDDLLTQSSAWSLMHVNPDRIINKELEAQAQERQTIVTQLESEQEQEN